MGLMRLPSWAGSLCAAALAPLAVAPSLVPRSAPIQGLLMAVAAVVGYAAGAAIGWLVRRARRQERWRAPRAATPAAGGLAVMWISGWLIAGLGWQQDLADLLGTPPPQWSWAVVSLLVGLTLTAALVGFGRVLRRVMTAVHSRVSRRTAEPVPALAVGAAALLAVVPVLNGTAGQAVVAVANPLFQSMNAATAQGVSPATSASLSGGPQSSVSWSSLGHDGRDFIGTTPDAASIDGFSGGGAQDPVRVYAGVETADTAAQRAQIAVAELKRFGAFDRAVLAVGTSTGTGTVDESAVRPLELMYNGDTATVSTQYSILPSFLSFLFDREAASAEAESLFAAVYDHWAQLPAKRRPLLVVFGESLGAFGATAPFPDLQRFSAQVDGALLVGPPNATPLWREYTSRRAEGSLQRLPVYDSGATLRWADDPADLADLPARWGPPRLAYLQNASDPVVWWAPDLLWSRPDWLAEPRGSDVLPGMPWLPFITFLGVSGDMIDSQSVPPGHGHVYGAAEAEAWARVIPPRGWSDADTARLVSELGG